MPKYYFKELYQDSIKALILGRVDVVEWSPVWVHGASRCMRLPSIVILKDYIPERMLARVPACNLYNLFLRDLGICQYTGKQVYLGFSGGGDIPLHATIDHVLPQFRGGTTVWENVALSSSFANNEKGNLLLWQTRFKLLNQPWVPTHQDLLYLWLTKYQVALTESPWSPWADYLKLVKPSDNAQRALEKYAKAA